MTLYSQSERTFLARLGEAFAVEGLHEIANVLTREASGTKKPEVPELVSVVMASGEVVPVEKHMPTRHYDNLRGALTAWLRAMNEDGGPNTRVEATLTAILDRYPGDPT